MTKTEQKTRTHRKTKSHVKEEDRISAMEESLKQLTQLVSQAIPQKEENETITTEESESAPDSKPKYKKIIKLGRAPEFSEFVYKGLKFTANPQYDPRTKGLKYYTFTVKEANRSESPVRFYPKPMRVELAETLFNMARENKIFDQIINLIEEIKYVNSIMETD